MDFDRMLRYCELLERNNNRTWFHDRDNHALYVAAKEDFTELLLDLKFRLSEVVAPDLAERLLFADPKAMQYRVPRDMRGKHGVPPYNPRWAADVSADRHSLLPLGYYVHIQPGGRTMFGTGAWCWEPEMLLRIRTAISAQFLRFADALEQSGSPLWGDQLKRVPRGFSEDDPAAPYLKYKSWLVSREFADAELRSFDGFVADCVAAAERMEPLRVFFNDALAGIHRNPRETSDWDAR